MGRKIFEIFVVAAAWFGNRQEEEFFSLGLVPVGGQTGWRLLSG